MIYVIEVEHEFNSIIGTTDQAASVRNIIENHFKMAIDNFTKIEGFKSANAIRAYYDRTKTTKVIIRKYRNNLIGHAGS